MPNRRVLPHCSSRSRRREPCPHLKSACRPDSARRFSRPRMKIFNVPGGTTARVARTDASGQSVITDHFEIVPAIISPQAYPALLHAGSRPGREISNPLPVGTGLNSMPVLTPSVHRHARWQPLCSCAILCPEVCVLAHFIPRRRSGELINRYVAALVRELEIVADDLETQNHFLWRRVHTVAFEPAPVGTASSSAR